MKKTIVGGTVRAGMLAAAVAASAQCGAIDLEKENWKVPNWNIIITEPGAVQKWIGKTWSGHCQGMCVSSNAIYFSFHDQIVKTDWQGRLNITHYQRNANQNYNEAGGFFPTVPSRKPLGNHLGSPWEIPRAARDMGSIPGSGRSPGEGNGNPLQYSCLENPMDRGAWQAPWGCKESMGLQRVGHN